MINTHRSCGHTPLFSNVRRWMRMAQLAKRLGVSGGELLARRQEGLSRRQLLKTAGAGAAAIALGGREDLAATASSARIAVVGGGMAGLNATYQMKKRGISADLYEGSNRISGRMFTGRGVFGPHLTTEYGGEYIDTAHRDMRNLCREFDLHLRNFATEDELAYDTTYLFGKKRFTEAQVIDAFEPIAEVIAQDQEDFIFDSYQSYNDLASELDHTSIAEYLTQAGATGWIYDLLDVAYNIEYGLETEEQSSLNLLYLIGTDTSEGLALYGESDERFTIGAGNDALTTAIAEQIEDRISLGHKLMAIKSRGAGFRLTFQKSGSGLKEVDCDICLLALPFTMLRQVEIDVDLPRAKEQAINELGYGTNAKLILGFNRQFWRDKGLNGEWFTDNGLQSGWDSSRLQPGEAGTLTYYSGGKNGVAVGAGTTAQQQKFNLPLFNNLFPGATARHTGKVVRFHWPTNPWTQGSYACYRVGQFTKFSGAEAEPVGNLLFAGEHCSSEFQGFMNGAAQTGWQAAHAIRSMVT